ncbi:MAG: IS110 family transposase [Eggerthellaceae bacterium]|nr:IS110 family transposase [Eggerthellaceae bacterium]
MAEYTISSEYGSLFGMDVHARSTTVRGFDFATGETRTKRFGDCPEPALIAEWMQEGFTGPHYAAYESGCTGFHMCRELRELGVDCDVVAASTIARSTDDKKRKNDRRDAKRLLSEMLSPEPSYSTVWLPDEECEGERDLVRARHDARQALKKSRQQANAILLRHGLAWNEKAPSGRLKTTWGRDHVKWIESQSLPGSAQIALQHYLDAISEQAALARKLDAVVREHAALPRWKPAVDALSHVKGIDVPSAFLLAVEFGDFSRFDGGRAVSCWAGLVPSSSDSADKHANGHITKSGNPYVRGALIEGLSNMHVRKSEAKKLRKGQEVSGSVRRLCRQCDMRMAERHERMSKEGKQANVIKVALANEMVRWVWAIGLAVEREQAS